MNIKPRSSGNLHSWWFLWGFVVPGTETHGVVGSAKMGGIAAKINDKKEVSHQHSSCSFATCFVVRG